jgi:hypothetical protein
MDKLDQNQEALLDAQHAASFLAQARADGVLDENGQLFGVSPAQTRLIIGAAITAARRVRAGKPALPLDPNSEEGQAYLAHWRAMEARKYAAISQAPLTPEQMAEIAADSEMMAGILRKLHHLVAQYCAAGAALEMWEKLKPQT